MFCYYNFFLNKISAESTPSPSKEYFVHIFTQFKSLYCIKVTDKNRV